jgi:hypothetical protein
MNNKKIFLANIGDKRKGAKYNMETNNPVKNEEINIIKRAVVEQIEELYKKIILRKKAS